MEGDDKSSTTTEEKTMKRTTLCLPEREDDNTKENTTLRRQWGEQSMFAWRRRGWCEGDHDDTEEKTMLCLYACLNYLWVEKELLEFTLFRLLK